MHILFTLILFLLPLVNYAQNDLAVSADIQLKLFPPFPKPHETVRVQANSFSFDPVTTPFTWYVNGKQVLSGKGETSITVTMGAVGSRTTIRVTANPPDNRPFDKSLVFYAGDVDLVWSADTYTPPGYPGKALPTPGATVHVVALPNLLVDGTRLSSKNLIYDWFVDGAPLKSQSGIGRDTLSVSVGTSANIQQSVKLHVEDQSGRTAQEKNLTITTRKPLLQFYELDPLRGPLYYKALADSTVPVRAGGEVKFFAAPFFIANGSLSLLTYAWRVGNQTLPPGTMPQILSYRSQSGSVARQSVSLEILNPSYIFENARESFTVDVK